MPRRRDDPFATFSVHLGEDGTGAVAYEKDGVIEVERVATCSCTWLTFPVVERLPDPMCMVPGHGEAD